MQQCVSRVVALLLTRRQAAEADAAYRQQIEQELMAKYGLGGNPVLAV